MERYKSTGNQHGYMHSLTSLARAFVAFASDAKRPVLDIGSAYGVASIPALERGATVIANDISAELLDTLADNAPAHLRPALRIIRARFPSELQLETASLDAVLISHVLPFLPPTDFVEGLSRIHSWLAPGGKVFVLGYTVYNGALKNFADRHDENLALGSLWPGHIEDVLAISSSREVTSNLPREVNCLHPEMMRTHLHNAGFTVERARIVPIEGDESDPYFQHLRHDGREWVEAIARK